MARVRTRRLRGGETLSGGRRGGAHCSSVHRAGPRRQGGEASARGCAVEVACKENPYMWLVVVARKATVVRAVQGRGQQRSMLTITLARRGKRTQHTHTWNHYIRVPPHPGADRMHHVLRVPSCCKLPAMGASCAAHADRPGPSRRSLRHATDQKGTDTRITIRLCPKPARLRGSIQQMGRPLGSRSRADGAQRRIMRELRRPLAVSQVSVRLGLGLGLG